MLFVQAKCPNCGVKLEVNNEQDVVECPYCHETFIIEKAIDNFAPGINISDVPSSDNLANAGTAFIKIEDYNSAERCFEEMTARYPQDYRGWWGLVGVYTRCFSLDVTDRGQLDRLTSYVKKAQEMCDSPEKINSQFSPYYVKMLKLLEESEKKKSIEIKAAGKSGAAAISFVQAKCTNCGANLEVDRSKDAAICPYCHTPYVVEKAIQNFITNNNITNNIQAGIVNVIGDSNADFVIRAGSLEKYNGSSTHVTIPDYVTSIDGYYELMGDYREYHGAFEGCKGLKSVVISNSVVSIGNGAFSRCSGLTSINIPNSVTFISVGCGYGHGCWEGAFSGCTSLRTIDIPNSVTSIGAHTFEGCSGLASITIPNSVTFIGLEAFKGCFGLTSITIPTSVTSIEKNAFAGCSGLTSITIPNSVTSIGVEAFEGCSGLTSVTIPNSVTSIGDKAFQGCSGLTSVTIPDSVTSVGANAFSESGLSNITLSDNEGFNFSDFRSLKKLPFYPVLKKYICICSGMPSKLKLLFSPRAWKP